MVKVRRLSSRPEGGSRRFRRDRRGPSRHPPLAPEDPQTPPGSAHACSASRAPSGGNNSTPTRPERRVRTVPYSALFCVRGGLIPPLPFLRPFPRHLRLYGGLPPRASGCTAAVRLPHGSAHRRLGAPTRRGGHLARERFRARGRGTTSEPRPTGLHGVQGTVATVQGSRRHGSEVGTSSAPAPAPGHPRTAKPAHAEGAVPPSGGPPLFGAGGVRPSAGGSPWARGPVPWRSPRTR